MDPRAFEELQDSILKVLAGQNLGLAFEELTDQFSTISPTIINQALFELFMQERISKLTLLERTNGKILSLRELWKIPSKTQEVSIFTQRETAFV